jgi:hypothetical protein
MAQTRFTCTLTRADEPAFQSYARPQSWTPKEPAPAHVPAMPSQHPTALPAPASTEPTPKALNEGERKALELAEERDRLRRAAVTATAQTRTIHDSYRRSLTYLHCPQCAITGHSFSFLLQDLH